MKLPYFFHWLFKTRLYKLCRCFNKIAPTMQESMFLEHPTIKRVKGKKLGL